tara:strand:+ start:518 stop:766 length:249 start_codon:yes stop_codon:yes gene_type:complete
MFSDINKKDLDAQTDKTIKLLMNNLQELHKEVYILREQVEFLVHQKCLEDTEGEKYFTRVKKNLDKKAKENMKGYRYNYNIK